MAGETSGLRRVMAELLAPAPAPSPAGFEEAASRLLHARHLAAYHWALPRLRGLDVLEIGTSRGYGSALILSRARRLIALELSRENACETRRETGADVVQADAQRIPLGDATMDAVIAFQVIEHVWDDRLLLGEIRRVLRPGGVLLASTPNARRRLLCGQMPWNEEHLREYDANGWRARLGEFFESPDVSALVGDETATAVEMIRTRPDPWEHFFGGPWAGPIRRGGRALRRMRAGRPGISPDELERIAAAVDGGGLVARYSVRESEPEVALDLLAICVKAPHVVPPEPRLSAAPSPARSPDTQVVPRPAPFDPESYWRHRLALRPGLAGTGTSEAPLSWQRWLYRGKRRAYLRLLRRGGVELPGRLVLDFGCGTGYFEEVWERAGARRADGIDIVPDAIERLLAAHPARRYLCADLGRDASGLRSLEPPDIVTAIDVLYHIVDDEALMRTLRALVSILRPGGALLLTDALIEQATEPHVRFRSFNQWLQILQRLGLAYVDREPVFAVNNRVARGVWRLPGLVGALQHFADLPLLRIMPWTANNWAVLARRSS